MKNEKLFKILTILVLIIVFSMALPYMGCKIISRDAELDEHAQRFGEALAKLQEEEKKQAEAEEAAAAEEVAEEEVVTEEETLVEEIEVAEEEENLTPNEPIIYSTSIDGAKVILIVNFKTKEVKGSISKSGEDYVDATIKGEIININTFEITTNYSGIEGSPGVEFTINGTITGKITEDLNIFNGVITPDSYDEGVEFTATR
jgi:hypothetical protein